MVFRALFAFALLLLSTAAWAQATDAGADVPVDGGIGGSNVAELREQAREEALGCRASDTGSTGGAAALALLGLWAIRRRPLRQR